MNSRWYLLPLSVAVIATTYAAFGPWAIFVAPLTIVLAIILNMAENVLQALLTFAAVLLLTALLLLPACCCCREAAQRMQCSNNLKQLGLALLNYENNHRCFPPANIPDKDGKPMHSWRVLLLPCLECNAIYGKYDFNEPWDGPNNQKLLSSPSFNSNFFRCPSDSNANTPESMSTSYVAVVGKNTAWRSGKPVSLKDLAPGEASKTILVIETADSGIQWNEPRDFCVDDISKADTNALTRIRGPHLRNNGYFYHPTPSGANAVFADGSVRFLPASMLTPDKLEKLFAIGGYDENLDRDDSLPEDLQINWFNCIALALWILSVVALLYWAIRTR